MAGSLVVHKRVVLVSSIIIANMCCSVTREAWGDWSSGCHTPKIDLLKYQIKLLSLHTTCHSLCTSIIPSGGYMSARLCVFISYPGHFTLIGSLSMQRFWATDGNRKCSVLVFNLSSHYHIYIVKYLFTTWENLRNTPILVCEMFTSGCRPWLKNVACLSSLICIPEVFTFKLCGNIHYWYIETKTYQVDKRSSRVSNLKKSKF